MRGNIIKQALSDPWVARAPSGKAIVLQSLSIAIINESVLLLVDIHQQPRR